MRAFAIASVLIVVLAVVGALGLGLVQKSSSAAYSTSSTRLDVAEAVNNYGRNVAD